MQGSILQSILGPRVPHIQPGVRRWRYALPTLLLLLAAALLVASFTQPYWNMTLHAPQYPKGLNVHAYLDHLGGDVQEVDNLNHYIGMRPLEEAAKIERSMALGMTLAMAAMLIMAVAVHSRWALLLALPALLFPVGFLLDLHLWMDHFGQNLDPTAALSSSVKPFTPPVLGEGWVGNFKTVARADAGLIMATVSSVLILMGLFFHRRAYKALLDSQRSGSSSPSSGHGEQPHRHVAAACNSVSARNDLAADISLRRSALRRCVPSPLRRFLFFIPVLAFAAMTHPSFGAGSFDLTETIAAADDHAIITVPAGTYGPLVIERPVTLIGHGRAVIDGGGEGDVVRITASGVTLRGFIIRNSGSSLDHENTGVHVLAGEATVEDNVIENVLFGIVLKSSPNSVVRNNIVGGKDLHIARRGDGIRLWNSHDALVQDNRIARSRDVVMWYSDRVHLMNNHISDSRYGLHFMYSHDNVLEHNRLEDNSVGAFLMYSRNLVVRKNVFARNRGPSGYGLGVKDMQGMVVEDNIFVGNVVAIYLDNPPVYLPEFDRITRNVLAYNDIGVAFQPSVRRTAVFENSFIENHQQVAVWGGGKLGQNRFTMNDAGNYWSDYRGYDLTGDGIGDMPYQAESLWDNLMDREPALRLFLFSPAQQAVELAAKAFPLVQSRPLFSDDAPLMQPIRSDLALSDPRSPGSSWAMAAGLLGIAGLALYGARPQMTGGAS